MILPNSDDNLLLNNHFLSFNEQDYMGMIYTKATRFFFLFLFCSFLSWNTLAGAEDIRVGIIKDFPPQYSTSNNGTPQGFAIDTIKEIARIAGLNIQFQAYENWADLFQAGITNQIDIIPNMGITDRRKVHFRYSSPIETFSIKIFIRQNNNDIRSIKNLNGKKVAVVKINIGEVIAKKHPDWKVQAFEHQETALFALLSGQVDAFIYPEPVLLKMLEKTGIQELIKPVSEPLREIHRGIAVTKSRRELLSRIEPALQTFLSSQAYRDVYLKWYAKPNPYWTANKIIAWGSTLIVLIILVMAIWRHVSVIKLNQTLTTSIRKQHEAEKELRQAHENLEEQVVERTRELKSALDNVKTLHGMLPICSHCKNIKNEEGAWTQLEDYLRQNSDAEFSHGLCHDCLDKHYPEFSHLKDKVK